MKGILGAHHQAKVGATGVLMSGSSLEKLKLEVPWI